MVGPEIFEQVKPLFACMGKSIVHVGPNGAGQVAQACNQMVLLITIRPGRGVHRPQEWIGSERYMRPCRFSSAPSRI
jgi:hypothetical protein